MNINDDEAELAHWIAAPMKSVGTIEQFHDVVARAEKVIKLLREREAAARLNMKIAQGELKKPTWVENSQ